MTAKTKQTFWIVASLALLLNFVVLVIALTDIIPDTPLKEYRFLIGMTFLTIGGFIRTTYKKQQSRGKT
jgi:hypothetical protein